RLLGGFSGAITRLIDEALHLGALTSTNPAGDEAARARVPMLLTSPGIHARAARTRGPFFVVDIQTDSRLSDSRLPEMARARGWRSFVAVPMLRGDQVLGTIGVSRREPGAFKEEEIALLQTFADQAVIAIENVRLFNETKEALDRQTATAEILRGIASSPTDLQPVLNAVAERAARLCGANDAVIFSVDGDVRRQVAHFGSIPVAVAPKVRLSRGSVTGRAIRERRTIHIHDILEEIAREEYEPTDLQQDITFRTILATPLLREEKVMGAIVIRRTEMQPFSDTQIALVKTFADQAVIAIENVRLFTELQEKNQALTQANAQVTEALEQQTATSDVLKVISSSPTDGHPGFDTIAQSAVRLCHGDFCTVARYDGELLHLVGHAQASPEGVDALRRMFPMRPTRATFFGRTTLERGVVHIPDVRVDAELARPLTQALHSGSGVGVPMLREGQVIGVIGIGRYEVQAFTDQEIALVQTFADQAVIAIENVRLFNELQARTQQLTRSVDQLTALGEVGRAVSSTLDLETVLTTIVSRAVDLSGLDGGIVCEYEEASEEFVQRAASQTGNVLASVLRGIRYRKGEGAIGQTAITRRPAQVPDITVPGAYDSRVRTNLIESGVRAVLAVPMIHQDRLIGCLGVTRNQPGDFPAETIDLLRTFATQSALAIQNARLFRGIEEKSRQLQVA